MTSQTTYPGWGYMKANDATTIWEMWEKDLPGHSLLHSSYLYPGAWYIDGMAGIRQDPASPGFQHLHHQTANAQSGANAMGQKRLMIHPQG